MIRTFAVVSIFITAPLLAHAQARSPGAEHKFSVGTGIGFAADFGIQTGFNWQLDAQYRVTDDVSVGGWMQVVPLTGVTLFSMEGDARYHFDVLRSNNNAVLSKVTPYAGLGMGFAHAGGAAGTAFLFSFIGGLEYDVNDHVAITSDMRLNLTSFNDVFYFSWQVIGARYRF